MRKRFHQYLYSLLFALLTVLGWYYGQIQQYISTDISSELHFTTDLIVHQNKSFKAPFAFLKNHEANDAYNVSHPRYNKIRANLSENDNENDDNVETSGSTELLALFKDGFWHLISGFVTTFHDRQIAVSLAQSEHLKPLDDDLYIQYRVIRL
ncbi:hypothetical protein [Chryseobacterium culicis]|uniref:Uncharacterized protein n=1 Tax=Chryseobacterium culicis TaxID=680127 RepID=A0A2S9D017_CHRCI|nr:hypothetical protein [Chryseobacterium culicis]PRB86051.1 hypothetical protein CQ022_07320 [Chryseobacterium culicis]PRB91804.1 hypothetical protein CQ033_00990 [Chryseobacterium culicis]